MCMTSGQCKKIRASLREALLTITPDRDELAAFSIESNPNALRDLWVQCIKREMKRMLRTRDAIPPGSFVESVLDSLPHGDKSELSHPRGASAEPDEAKEYEDSVVSDEEYVVSSTSSEDEDNDRLVSLVAELMLPAPCFPPSFSPM